MDIFDRNSPKYKCCCNSCHVKTGAEIVAAVEFVVVVVEIVLTITSFDTFTDNSTNRAMMAAGVGIKGIFLFALALLVAGLSKQKKELLIPYMIIQTLQILAIIGFGIYISTTNRFLRQLLVILSLGAAFYMWFLVIIVKCYHFFSDLEKFQTPSTSPNMVNKASPVFQGGHPVSDAEKNSSPPPTYDSLFV